MTHNYGTRNEEINRNQNEILLEMEIEMELWNYLPTTFYLTELDTDCSTTVGLV